MASSVYDLLEEIQSGKRAFSPAGSSDKDYEDFQGTVEALREAYEEGYISSLIDDHHESQTGKGYIDLVMAGNLTNLGQSFLDECSG